MSRTLAQKQVNAQNLPYYVYVWSYPDGTVFHVGMGQDDRGSSMNHRSSTTIQICKSIESMGYSVQRSIVASFKVKQHAHVYEKMLIACYGIDNLTNIKSEDGETTSTLAMPFQYSIIETIKHIPHKTVDKLTSETLTRQPWEDDGAAI